MKNFFSIFIFSLFILGGLLLSCKSKALPEISTEKTTTIKEIVRDTVLHIEKDSSFYQAYIECRDGRAVLIEPKEKTTYEKAGKYLETPKVQLTPDGKLTVNCEQKAQEIFFTWKEKFIEAFKREIVKIPPKEVEKELTTFQEVKLFIGNVVFWILCAVAAAFLIRFLISKKLF